MPAKTLTRKLGGSWSGSSGTAACPVCQPERRKDQHALSITWKSGKLLLFCKKSKCSYQDILAVAGFDAPKTEKLSASTMTEERVIAGRKRAQAALLAEEIMSLSVRRKHGYLTLKGFPTLELPTVEMRQLRGVMPIPKVIQHVNDSETLLCIPLSTFSNKEAQVTTLQLISPSSEKCFLIGGRTGGAGWFPVESGARPLVLTEGAATALSVLRVAKRLGSPVSVGACMSAGGIVAMSRKLVGDAVMADCDKSKTGEIAARATGLLWTMPPKIGYDFNDLEQEDPKAAEECLKKIVFVVPWFHVRTETRKL